MLRRVVSVVLPLLLIAAAARADGDDDDFREGRWGGGTVEGDGHPFCIMSAHFESGGAMFVVLTADRMMALGFERKGWSFAGGERPRLRVQLDGRSVKIVGPIGDAELVIVGIPDPRA